MRRYMKYLRLTYDECYSKNVNYTAWYNPLMRSKLF